MHLKNKKVVHIVQHLRPGGIEVLAVNMMKDDPDNTFIVSLEGTSAKALHDWSDLEQYKDNLLFLNKPSKVSIKTILELVIILKKMCVDVVHTHHIGPLLYGGISSRVLLKKLVHTEHDAWYLNQKKSYRLQRKLLHFLKPKIVADAHHVASKLKSFFPKIDPLVIHNGVDMKKFKPLPKMIARKKLGLPEAGKFIGCAARLEEVKGHRVLLSAFSQLKGVDTYLVLAGRGSLKEKLLEQSKILGVQDRVFFLGHVNDMTTFYSAIDVFCLASYQEGFPLSPLEAQACDVPCVLTDVGGCNEMINGETGVLSKPGDVQSLSNGLKATLLQKKTKSIRKCIEGKADISVMNAKYKEVYG